MIIDDKIRDKNLQYDINREAAKLLALLSNIIFKSRSNDRTSQICKFSTC